MHALSETWLIEPIAISEISPDIPQALSDLRDGNAQGLFARALAVIDTQPAEALQLLERAAALAQGVGAIHSAMHSALCRLGREDEALVRINMASRLEPANSEHHYNRAVLLSHMGRAAEAETSYRQAIDCDPKNLDAFVNLGSILMESRRFADALACFDHVITRRPADIDARNNRLNVLVAAGLSGEACEGFVQLIAEKPGNPTLMLNFANALRAAGRAEEASQWVALASAADPTDYSGRLNAAKLLLAQGFTEKALGALRLLVMEAPTDVSVVSSLALALRACNPHGVETHEAFGRLASLPTALVRWRTAIGQWKLLNGDFSTGLLDYESRWNTPDGPRLRRDYTGTRWTGEQPIEGKVILVHFEQGAGDTLQYVRYVSLLRDRGARVVLEVPASLEKLVQDSGLAEVVVTSTSQTLPHYDFHCPLMSLPLAFGTTLESIPGKTPYLKTDPALCDQWRERLGARRAPRIGVVWNGRRENSRDESRSLTFMRFMRALPLGPEYICLQPEIRREDAFLMQARPDIVHFADCLNDYADTAALVERLDWVITVDTSIAHLAGALNKPVWIMLPHDPDFRWLLGRDDSPWYPSARLYRQPQFQDWDTVLSRVRADILSVLEPSQ